MPQADRSHNGGIDETAEWRLITGLREICKRFSMEPKIISRRIDKSTIPLLTAICSLDVNIRQTFTIVPLELLRDLESERDDDESQSTLSGGLSALQNLCSDLEARVNPLLVPIELVGSSQTQHYPRLMQLFQHLGSRPLRSELKFIPTQGSPSTEFLFNIAKDTTTANDFVAFSGRVQTPPISPPKDTQARMIQAANDLSSRVFYFNLLVHGLQMSPASMVDVAPRPSENLASNQSFASCALFRQVFQQTATACRAAVSQFGSCDRSQSVDHEILLQLPGWEDILNWDSEGAAENPSIQLFFTVCSLSKWQAAKMYFYPPKSERQCKQQELCRALRSSHKIQRDLEFYVSEDCERVGGSKIPIKVPLRLNETQKFGTSFPNHAQSLWTMIKQDYFSRHRTVRLLMETDFKGRPFGTDERKALATRLVLGLMVCLDSNEAFESWNPECIHFLQPKDAQRTPFVSIPSKEGSTSHQNWRLQAALLSCNSAEDDLGPLPQFMLLAKALIQIATGESLEGIKIVGSHEEDLQEEWEILRRTLNTWAQDLTIGKGAYPEMLPLLIAAKGCLEFHIEYRIRLSETPSIPNIDLARKVVFDTILVEIDHSLTLKGLVVSSPGTLAEQDVSIVPRRSVIQGTSVLDVDASTQQTPSGTVFIQGPLAEKLPSRHFGAPTMQPSQPNVVLFDTQLAEGESRADEFWKHLNEFHSSYSKSVTDRTTTSNEELPKRIRIAVLDTGIDFGHSGIQKAMEKGRMKMEWCHSWVEGDAKDNDSGLHGTNCAYLLHKAAPEADIYVEKVFNKNAISPGEAENIDKAIMHAVKTWKVDIISMSFGLKEPQAREDGNKDEEQLAFKNYKTNVNAIRNAIERAADQRTLMFAAASNSGRNEPRAFPASVYPVFCIYASEGNGYDGRINPTTETGFNFMTLGMGLKLLEKKSSSPGYKEVVKSGTSFATPIAAGIAATVLDLAARAAAIDEPIMKQIRGHHGLGEILQIMSNHKSGDQLCYLAPWLGWGKGFQISEDTGRWVWNAIASKLSR